MMSNANLKAYASIRLSCIETPSLSTYIVHYHIIGLPSTVHEFACTHQKLTICGKCVLILYISQHTPQLSLVQLYTVADLQRYKWYIGTGPTFENGIQGPTFFATLINDTKYSVRNVNFLKIAKRTSVQCEKLMANEGTGRRTLSGEILSLGAVPFWAIDQIRGPPWTQVYQAQIM